MDKDLHGQKLFTFLSSIIIILISSVAVALTAPITAGVTAGVLFLITLVLAPILVFTIYKLIKMRKEHKEATDVDSKARTSPETSLQPSAPPNDADTSGASSQANGILIHTQPSCDLAKAFSEAAEKVEKFPGEFPPIMFVECMRTILTHVPLEFQNDKQFRDFVENMILIAENMARTLRSKPIQAQGDHATTDDGGDKLNTALDMLQHLLETKYQSYCNHSDTGTGL